MALNTKTFVNTGGLYPGGVTGLTILIQRIFKLLLDITLPFSVVNIFLNSIPVYIGFRLLEKNLRSIHVLWLFLTAFLLIWYQAIFLLKIFCLSVFWGNNKRSCYWYMFKCRRYFRRNRLYIYFFIRETRNRFF